MTTSSHPGPDDRAALSCRARQVLAGIEDDVVVVPRILLSAVEPARSDRVHYVVERGM